MTATEAMRTDGYAAYNKAAHNQPPNPTQGRAGCATAQPAQPAQPLRIIHDSREQAPFAFSGYPCTVEVATLASGDYSLFGFTDRIGIERKSLADLVGCLGAARERFQRELARLRGYDAAAVVIEAPSADLRAGHYRGKLDAGAAWQSVLAFSMRYRMPFIWCQDRADAERVTFDFLRHFARDRWKEFSALQDGVGQSRQGRSPVRARA